MYPRYARKFGTCYRWHCSNCHAVIAERFTGDLRPVPDCPSCVSRNDRAMQEFFTTAEVQRLTFVRWLRETGRVTA